MIQKNNRADALDALAACAKEGKRRAERRQERMEAERRARWKKTHVFGLELGEAARFEYTKQLYSGARWRVAEVWTVGPRSGLSRETTSDRGPAEVEKKYLSKSYWDLRRAVPRASEFGERREFHTIWMRKDLLARMFGDDAKLRAHIDNLRGQWGFYAAEVPGISFDPEAHTVQECRSQIQRVHPDKGGSVTDFTLWKQRLDMARRAQ